MNSQNIDDRPHAEFSPSRLNYLDLCPGWASSGSGKYADRGTSIGEMCAKMAMSGEAHEDLNQFTIDTLAEICVDGYEFQAEERLDSGISDVWGYADLTGRDGWGNAILVEVKSGFGPRLTAWDMPQVIAYALGLLNIDGIVVVDANVVEVDKKKHSKAIFTHENIPEMRSRIEQIIARAKNCTEKDLNCGVHCKYCTHAASGCPQLGTSAKITMDSLPIALPRNEASIKSWASTLEPRALAQLMDDLLPKCELVSVLHGALKSRAMALLETGFDIPGYHIKTTCGPREFNDPEDADKEIRRALGECINEAYSLKSVAQLEKLLKKNGIDDSFLEGITKKTTRRSLKKSH